MTSEPSRPHVERFATSDAPPHEQFEAWAVEIPFFDFAPGENARHSFDMRCQHVSFGPFILENRVLADRPSAVLFGAERTSRHTRADQHDYFCFNLQVSGTLSLRTRSLSQTKQAGDIYLLDSNTPPRVVTRFRSQFPERCCRPKRNGYMGGRSLKAPLHCYAIIYSLFAKTCPN